MCYSTPDYETNIGLLLIPLHSSFLQKAFFITNSRIFPVIEIELISPQFYIYFFFPKDFSILICLGFAMLLY